MKLRCTTDSIRIRIRKSELQQLAKERLVQEQINFGNQVVFTFALTVNDALEAVSASLQDQQLVVALPTPIAKQWLQSNQVGIEVNTPTSETTSLHILIEKDFPCLDREEENKADTFWELVPEKPDNC